MTEHSSKPNQPTIGDKLNALSFYGIFGHGKWVIIAVWDKGDSETWIPTKENGSPHLELAVVRLQSVTKLLERSIETYISK